MKKSKDGRCIFDPHWNSFLLDGKKRLRSWSKILKQYSEQVDSRVLAEKVVAKRGGNVEQLLKEWQDKADQSKTNGIAVHSLIDQYCLSKVIKVPCTPKEATAVKFIHDFFETGRLITLESEQVVYNEEFNCATLVDWIGTGNGKKYIIDWKTDTVIKDNHYGKYLKQPFSILPDHPLMHHKLQLNFCKSMYGHDIDGMFIGHISDTAYKLIPVENMNLTLSIL